MDRWIFLIIANALKHASPAIIEDLRRMVADMMTRAEATPNPYDDMFVGLLQMIVGKPGETVEKTE
jgi:hypothetical protein